MKRIILTSLLLTMTACANLQAWNDRGVQMKRAEANESDPDVKKWVAAMSVCQAMEGTSAEYRGKLDHFLEDFRACHKKADDDLMATWQHDSETQPDEYAKTASASASRCVAAANLIQIDYGITAQLQVRDVDAVHDCGVRRQNALAQGSTSRNSEVEKLTAENTTEAWLGFIETHPGDGRTADAAKRVVLLASAESGEARSKTEERLLAAYPAALDELPVDRRVLLIGPKGTRVRDLKKMQDAKLAQPLILARIKASSEPFKSFDGDEIIALKGLGFSDDVVAAMIDVTAKLEERKQADDERQAIRLQLAELKKMIAEKKAASSDGKTSGETVQTKEGPLDVLTSCAKRLGAVKLCEQIPFPGSSLCTSTAESSFPCNKS